MMLQGFNENICSNDGVFEDWTVNIEHQIPSYTKLLEVCFGKARVQLAWIAPDFFRDMEAGCSLLGKLIDIPWIHECVWPFSKSALTELDCNFPVCGSGKYSFLDIFPAVE